MGGKTALDWHGVRHYVLRGGRALHLYGWETASLPGWFAPERFPADYRRKRLFREQPQAMLHVLRRASGESLRLVARACVAGDVLSEVGLRQPLPDAREITEGTRHLRSRVLRQLLERCTSVKTVRLCLQLGRELALPWAKELELPTPCEPEARLLGWPDQREGLLVLK